MVVCSKQLSGLGNQLFQYAAGLYFAERYHARLLVIQEPSEGVLSHGLHPRPFLLSQFQIASPHRMKSRFDELMLRRGRRWLAASAALKAAGRIAVRHEPTGQHGHFIEELHLPAGTRKLYLSGYWQAYQYAEANAVRLREEFRLREEAKGGDLRILEQISATATPVSLHLRRGDYTLAAEGSIALSLNYYRRAVELIRQQCTDPVFFIFSDDLDFARNNLPDDLPKVFVEGNDDFSSHEDLRLMSACRHHIMANSSFSWWGAWLNPNPDKIVVAPRHWRLTAETAYPDLLPPHWHALDSLREG